MGGARVDLALTDGVRLNSVTKRIRADSAATRDYAPMIMIMIETAKLYERAGAKEREAFEAMVSCATWAPEYPALVEKWNRASSDADAARAKMIAGFSTLGTSPSGERAPGLPAEG